MSAPNRIAIETQRWLAYAKRDLRAAEVLLVQGNDFCQQVCFLSQQAAEKGLKASLIFLQIEFPFSHDLDLLNHLLPQDWQLRQTDFSLGELTQWAVEARYSTLAEEPSAEEAATAVRQAKVVLASMEECLRQQDVSW